MKNCPDCGQYKATEDFPRNRSTSDGRGVYCKPCHNARHKDTLRRLYGGSNRSYHLRRKYGITAADVESLIAKQGGLCAVCLMNPAVQVDHDHKLAKFVRGILCDGCNGGIGLFKEKRSSMKRAIEYLTRKETV